MSVERVEIKGLENVLSPISEDILIYLNQEQLNAFYSSPSVREIATATHISSTSVVNYNLGKLVKLGYIHKGKKSESRSIALICMPLCLRDRAKI